MFSLLINILYNVFVTKSMFICNVFVVFERRNKVSAKDKIKELIDRENITLTKLAEIMDMSQQNLNQKISRDSIRYKDMEDIAKKLNYKIEWTKINNNSTYLNNEETQLISSFKKLSQNDKYRIIGMIEGINSTKSKNSNDGYVEATLIRNLSEEKRNKNGTKKIDKSKYIEVDLIENLSETKRNKRK